MLVDAYGVKISFRKNPLSIRRVLDHKELMPLSMFVPLLVVAFVQIAGYGNDEIGGKGLSGGGHDRLGLRTSWGTQGQRAKPPSEAGLIGAIMDGVA